MSPNIRANFNWDTSTSATSTATYYRQMSARDFRYRGEETYTWKVIKERDPSEEVKVKEYLEGLKQYTRGSLGGFEKQYKQEDVKEPQTIFHFDPERIVNQWPEKKKES